MHEPENIVNSTDMSIQIRENWVWWVVDFFGHWIFHQVDEVCTDLDSMAWNSRSRAHYTPRWTGFGGFDFFLRGSSLSSENTYEVTVLHPWRKQSLDVFSGALKRSAWQLARSVTILWKFNPLQVSQPKCPRGVMSTRSGFSSCKLTKNCSRPFLSSLECK